MRDLLKTTWPKTTAIGLTFVFFVTGSPRSFAQPNATNQPWAYQLLEGTIDQSYLIEGIWCKQPPCPTVGSIFAPMGGTFNLRLVSQDPLFAHYAVEDISFKTGPIAGSNSPSIVVKGGGTFEFGGEAGLFQQMFLQVDIDNGFTHSTGYFTNTWIGVDRFWPMIDVSLYRTNLSGAYGYDVFFLRLAAAPVREFWVSTASGFTSAYGQPPTNYVSDGDLISLSGRVVKRNAELTGQLHIMPMTADLGLDAVSILPGGEIAFSLAQNAFSETLGPLQHGDLLSNQGRIIQRNQDLLAAFAPQPAAPDAGLDAVQVLDSGEVLFSIATNVFSKNLGVTLQRGDLLSNSGRVVRSNQQLLARFHPTNATNDYGLDAFFVWPQGEIWFSTEQGFQDQDPRLGAILAGDLLSDAGYRVFRNLKSLQAFAPLENRADFGLDGLFIVTDDTAVAPAPHFTGIRAIPSTSSARLTWQGLGRVFQVESAGLVTDSFQPLSPILPDLSFDDAGTMTNRAQAYYLLRQW